ncbi:Phosphoinositide phosphatase SAC1 [Platanthera guangdongensis]|uniref:Phosphoinositide phosphatase SAC1 n=1 Tax=Platanthera guangdongensis TaxID=2320717 RepID=A0ABR2N5Y6_9ASPA
MLPVTKRRKVGCICGHKIYAISKTEMIASPQSTVRPNMAFSKNENRFSDSLRGSRISELGRFCRQDVGAFSGQDGSEFVGCCANSMELAGVRHGSKLVVWMLDRGVSFVARTGCLELAQSDEAVCMDSGRLRCSDGRGLDFRCRD